MHLRGLRSNCGLNPVFGVFFFRMAGSIALKAGRRSSRRCEERFEPQSLLRSSDTNTRNQLLVSDLWLYISSHIVLKSFVFCSFSSIWFVQTVGWWTCSSPAWMWVSSSGVLLLDILLTGGARIYYLYDLKWCKKTIKTEPPPERQFSINEWLKSQTSLIFKPICWTFLLNKSLFFLFLCRFGRIKSLLLSNVINFISGIAMAVVPNYVSVLVLRAVLGFSIKGGWMTAYVLRKNCSITTDT